MAGLVEKYTQNFPTHEPVSDVRPRGNVVLITGTTGAIGSNTLAELFKSPDVTMIIVLARKSTTAISVRQKKALGDRGLDPKVLNSPKITLLEGDPALPGLGLEDNVLSELRSLVTHVLHIGMYYGERAPSSGEKDLNRGFRVESGFQPWTFIVRT